MSGTATLLALMVLAAAPGSATVSSDGNDNLVQVMFQEQNPFVDENGDSGVRSPAPKRLPRELTSGGKPARLTSSQEGIPGLAPLEEEEEQPAPPKETAKPKELPKPKEPPKVKETPKPVETPKPSEPPKTVETPKYEEAVQPKSEMGETFCTDDSVPTACDAACNAACDGRQSWLRSICVDGWIDQGATINTLSPRDRSNGTVTFNNRSNEYQLNQSYFRLSRAIDAECDVWQVGGQVDMLYGTDSYYTSARGLEVYGDLAPKWNAQQYGLSMPQAYMELYAPWGNGLSMKLGHFYSMFGYETVTAPDNFFYSHSYVFQYGEPFTYTGLLGSMKFGEFTVDAGMTRGWNNWESLNNDLNFAGGVHWTSANERTNIAINVTAGREQPDQSTNIRSVYSLVIQQKLGERWQYVIQHDYGSEPEAGIGGNVANWYGLNQYFFYTINETWKAGMRCEWFRDEGGARVPDFRQTADYYELSAGLNWTPDERVTVRPELRWDWTTTADCRPFGDHTQSSQILLDCDVIVRF